LVDAVDHEIGRVRNAGGELVLAAIHFGQLDDAGRITKMADFFGKLPPRE
jgi:hypothetical protein